MCQKDLKSSNNPHLSVSLRCVAVRHSKKPADRQMECCNYTQEGERERLFQIISGQTIRVFPEDYTFSSHLRPFRSFYRLQCYFLLAVPFAILPKLLLCLTLRLLRPLTSIPRLLLPAPRSLPPVTSNLFLHSLPSSCFPHPPAESRTRSIKSEVASW